MPQLALAPHFNPLDNKRRLPCGEFAGSAHDARVVTVVALCA